MKGITCDIERVTPAKAMQMLAKNPNNRHVTHNHVTVLAREMKMGDWQVTGQGISISDKGELLDGQHRLLAVEESGKTVNMLIVRGIKRKAMNVIDTVAKQRSASDIFSMRGVKNPVTVASCIKVINQFSLKGRFNALDHAAGRITQAQYDEYLKTFPQIEQWAHWALSVTERVMFPSLIAGLGVVFGMAETEEGQAQDFMHKIDSGEMIKRHEPIYELRKQLMRYNANKKSFRIRPETIVWLTIKTWNSHVSGDEIKTLAVSGRERMPLVIGFDPTVLPYYYTTGGQGELLF